MDKNEALEWIIEGSVIYYYYLSGGIAISNPNIEGYKSVQWLSFGTFDELRKEGQIKKTGEGNYTLIKSEKYQCYMWNENGNR